MAAERAAFLMTECNQKAFSFAAHFSRRVEASFTAGQVSTDGGALLCGRPIARSVCWSGECLVSPTGGGRLLWGDRLGRRATTALLGRGFCSKNSTKQKQCAPHPLR